MICQLRPIVFDLRELWLTGGLAGGRGDVEERAIGIKNACRNGHKRSPDFKGTVARAPPMEKPKRRVYALYRSGQCAPKLKIDAKGINVTEIKTGDQVGIHYTGTLEDGSVFDSSEGRDPLEFEVGSGQIIVGLDEALPGMVVGEKKVVQIPCDLAYGPSNPEMKQAVPREGIPDDIPLEIGLTLHMQTPSGQPLPVTVVEMDEATVTLDANHALAGKDLTFDIEIVKIN
jgi:FKBP-type peptidyl-prolyl cis-trans isomerase 2